MSIFSYTSTHGMIKKTPLGDYDDHYPNDDHDDSNADADADRSSELLLWVQLSLNLI